MSITYKKAPLVELIAEIRWSSPNTIAPDSQQPRLQFSLPHPSEELFYQNYGTVLSSLGYGRVERIIPPGVPTPMNTVACRFRPYDPEQQSPLFQVGRGIFTANALPPEYQSWQTFSPVVRMGLDMVFHASKSSGLPLPQISEVLIRYVDIFSGELMGGNEINDFVADTLGFKLSLPDGITSITKPGTTVQQVIQLQQQIDIGLLSITVGPARKEGEAGLMLDASILVQREIGNDIDAAISALTEARGVIHVLFRKLTEPLHKLMEPVE